jgi:NAD(P)H dehydrogenase (quinone)
VSVRQADYTQDPATLASALAGVDTLLLISGNEIGQREAQHRHVIEAAKRAGVKHLVYTSLLHADRSPLSLAPEHLATEAMIRASGIHRAAQRLVRRELQRWLPAAVAHGALLGSAGEGRLSLATRADYAEAAATVLADPAAHAGRLRTGWRHRADAGRAGRRDRPPGRQAGALQEPAGRRIHRRAAQRRSARGLGVALPQFDLGAAQGALFDDGHQLS